MEMFEKKIMHEDAGEIVQNILAKYEAVNYRLKRLDSDRIKYGI